MRSHEAPAPISECEPHRIRRQAILAAHPEIRDLRGPFPWTALLVAIPVLLQVGIALSVGGLHWGWVVLLAYGVGAVLALSCFLPIHEATHGLIFRSVWPNHLVSIFANLGFFVPSGVAYRKFHTAHHWHLGEPSIDPDHPLPFERRLGGNHPLTKALWLGGFMFWQAFRVTLRTRVQPWDAWNVTNWLVQIAFLTAVWAHAGPNGVLYLFLSTFFTLGLHPCGGRVLQEHFVFAEGQETSSYYGPLNKVIFNVGYHVEHHDFPEISWVRLPQVRVAAPEFYDTLVSHPSWTALILRFIFDPKLGLHSRVERPTSAEVTHEPPLPYRGAGRVA